MIKKIIFFLILFFWFWINELFADSVTLVWMSSNATFYIHKIWTTKEWFLDNQYSYIEDWWYFISNWSSNCFYNHLWQVITNEPFSCSAFTYINQRYWKYQIIETERFQYFITKPYNSNTSQSSSSYKTSYVIAYDKKEDNFYQNAYARSYSHTSAPYWFFLEWQLYFKHYQWPSRYTFNINDELWIWFQAIETPWPNIQHTSVSWTTSYNIKYNWSDYWSSLYSVSWNSLVWTTWINDNDLWVVKTSSSLDFPENPYWINISRTSYQDYNCLNYKWDILCSFYSWNHSTPTEETFNVYSYKLSASSWTWTYYPDVYFHHYNNYYFDWSNYWWGWFQSKTTIIEDNIKFTRFWPMKVWYYSESAWSYKKTYFTADYYLKTNDVLNSTVDFTFTNTTTSTGVIIENPDSSTSSTSSNLDLSDNSKWFFSELFNGLFWVQENEITDLQNSLNWALNTWTNWFSIWTWWTSWINYTPWNNDYWTIINRNNNDKTCDMFNTDWSFAYYSNWSYDLSIDLNWILNLWYVDKVPFLEELLFIPNKILSFITNPLQNIFSTLRVFWWIWENTYCYFWTLQTIKFQKHIIVWTSFFWWELIFIPWTLTIIDYLILFFMWLPLLILTVRIFLY